MKKLAVTFLIVLISCKSEEKKANNVQVFTGNAIGTTYSIQAFSAADLDVKKEIDSIIAVFNNSMSTWQADSKINRFNKTNDSTVVSDLFTQVFNQAQEVYRKTDGYFDPTVGNLVNAYGFGASGKRATIPTQEHIDSLMQYVGFYHLSIDKVAGNTILSSRKKGVYLEFNAIGKGTLVDHIAALLKSKGVENYLVEIGGEVIASGLNKDKGTAWTVGIEDPKNSPQSDRKYLSVINLQDKSMAGSGNYRKIKTDKETGKTYVHTVNPLTGTAALSNVIGVNVIAANCTLADAYATAIMAMPLEKSKALLPSLEDIDVIILYLDENGMLKFELTPGFESYIKKAA